MGNTNTRTLAPQTKSARETLAVKGSWGGAEAGAQGEGQGPAVTWDGHRVTAGSPLPAQGSVLFRWAGGCSAWPTAGLRHKELPPPTPCFAQRRCRCPRGPQGLVFSRQEEGGLWGDGGSSWGQEAGLASNQTPTMDTEIPQGLCSGACTSTEPRAAAPVAGPGCIAAAQDAGFQS